MILLVITPSLILLQQISKWNATCCICCMEIHKGNSDVYSLQNRVKIYQCNVKYWIKENKEKKKPSLVCYYADGVVVFNKIPENGCYSTSVQVQISVFCVERFFHNIVKQLEKWTVILLGKWPNIAISNYIAYVCYLNDIQVNPNKDEKKDILGQVFLYPLRVFLEKPKEGILTSTYKFFYGETWKIIL